MTIKIITELQGTQTATHCSAQSSIGHCDKLATKFGKCTQYKRGLEYDMDAHAYKRCEECLKGEVLG